VTDLHLFKKLELRRFIDTIILGVAGALSARAFVWMLGICQRFFLWRLAGYQEPTIGTEGPHLPQVIGPHGLWLIPLVTTLGGLISGILVFTFAPEAEGHGTDTVVQAFHRAGGIIRRRVPFVKMIASAITIGSGGSAGREGPTALITAGFSSIYASLTHRSEEDRRLLIIVGTAAGLSAIFRSPIGTAVFAVEVLYGSMEFESRALVYTTLASVVAYAGTGFFTGLHPLFNVPPNLSAPGFRGYLWYALLGLASGLIGVLLPNLFYRMRDGFRRVPGPHFLKPAIGGLGVGLLALEWPQILGGGYGWMQQAIDGQLAIHLMLALLFVKMVAFALTISPGGSGGVFAPTLFVGAMLGGALSGLHHEPTSAFVIVGMAALFGAAARVPMAALLMVLEMTNGFQLLVPAGLAVIVAFVVQSSLSDSFKYASLYEAQVANRLQSPAHYLDALRTAFDLIGSKRIEDASNLGAVDMLALLESGIPLQLAGDKQLFIGVVHAGSPLIGATLESISKTVLSGSWNVMSIFRDDGAVVPSPAAAIKEDDRLLIACSPEVRRQLAGHLVFLGDERQELNV
jgi:chloride channel protein, CIC family